MAQTKEAYVINKEVAAMLKNGEKIIVGHIRSRDGKVLYFNPVRGVGNSWIDSLSDAVEADFHQQYEFA